MRKIYKTTKEGIKKGYIVRWKNPKTGETVIRPTDKFLDWHWKRVAKSIKPVKVSASNRARQHTRRKPIRRR